MSNSRFNRSSGVLMHISSLPSPYGIGTLGKAAFNFVDFLSDAGQKYWQILPIGHTGFGNSPYQCFSTVAGNPFFIDLDDLISKGLLTKEDVYTEVKNIHRVDFDQIIEKRLGLLKKAFKNASHLKKEIEAFVDENSDWLPDYSLFMAIKQKFGGKPIWEWEDDSIRKRDPIAIAGYLELLQEEVEFFNFVQYMFFEQWNLLKTYANKNGIEIIGDIPIYPSPDSCDVWVNSEIFKVDDVMRPSGIAGVPPDIYSETGQLWGNPVYDWNVLEEREYDWWIWRIKHTLKIADVIRIDHFRAFQDYWEIPAEEKTAINGKWCPGPRMKFFEAVKKALGDIPIIAEDLGIIDDSVKELLEKTGYPGMKVMIFGLQENEDNIHLPHNWEVNCVGYTSTHDSETFVQKVEMLNPADKQFAKDYIYSDESLGLGAIRSAFASPANLVIVPMQDVLSLGQEGRMNTPSTIGENWEWRASNKDFSKDLADKLCKITKTYKREN